MLPPDALSPVTVYEAPQASAPRRPGAPRSRARHRRRRRGRARRVAHRRHLPLAARERRCSQRAFGGRESRADDARRRAAGRQGRDRAGDRLRPPARRGGGNAVALGHDDAAPRRSADGHDLDAVPAARHGGRDPLPGLGLHLEDQRRVLHLWREGRARHRPQPHRVADQLPDHRQLPRLQEDRQHARRCLGGRRPSLLQRQRRCQPRVRLREDQPPARLPAADGRRCARLRALPAYRLRLPPRCPPAAVRDGHEGAVRARLLADEGAEPRRRDHEERRGRRRRRRRVDPAHDPSLRALRLRAPGWPLLPGEDRRADRVFGADDRQRERPGCRLAVLQPRRGGAEGRHRRGAEAQAEVFHAEAGGHDRRRPQRLRRPRRRRRKRGTCSASAVMRPSKALRTRPGTRRGTTSSTRRCSTTAASRRRAPRPSRWPGCSGRPRQSRTQLARSAPALRSNSLATATCGRWPTARCSQSSSGRPSTTSSRRPPRGRRSPARLRMSGATGSATVSLVRSQKNKVDFDLMVPSVLDRSSSPGLRDAGAYVPRSARTTTPFASSSSAVWSTGASSR